MNIFSKIFGRKAHTTDPLLDEMQKRVREMDKPLGDMCQLIMSLARLPFKDLSRLIKSDEAGRVDKEMALLFSLFFLYVTLLIRKASHRLTEAELAYLLKYLMTLGPGTVIEFYRPDLPEDAKQILIDGLWEELQKALSEYGNDDLVNLLPRASSVITEACGQLNNPEPVSVVQERLFTTFVIVEENLNIEQLLIDIRRCIPD